MTQHDWQAWPDRGFLISPDPIRHLSEVDTRIAEGSIDQVESIAAELPQLLKTHRLRPTLDDLPAYDYSHLAKAEFDFRAVERLTMLYSYFASAYVYADGGAPSNHIPAGVAVPLVQLSHMVGRPPILSYATMVLGNWQRKDRSGPFVMDNLMPLQTFLGLPDESWFSLVHVTVEAQAALITNGIRDALRAVETDDPMLLHDALQEIIKGLIAAVKAFHQMRQGCDPDVYYEQVRSYLFGFNNILYEGVDEYKGKPQTFRGGSGAQSTIVPALVAALGIRHNTSELTAHLDVMKKYMPPSHRDYIASVTTSAIRDYVRERRPLADTYNACIRQLITFRRAHFYYARTYIFEKSTNPIGTGGTMFMDFLTRLIEETEAHLL